jgi:hypothetical protein
MAFLLWLDSQHVYVYAVIAAGAGNAAMICCCCQHQWCMHCKLSEFAEVLGEAAVAAQHAFTLNVQL